MIYVKGSHGTFIMDREVSPSDSRRLYSARAPEKTISGVREAAKHSQSPIDWWGRRWQNDRSESDVSSNRVRLSSNQWF